MDTETQLAEEIAGVCRDYCTEVWAEALNRARVPADFELRKAGNTFFLEDIWEVPSTLLPLAADLLPLLEQPSTIQAPSPDIEVSVEADKGKEVQPPMKTNCSKDSLTIRDMVSKAKDVESKSKARDTKLQAVDSKEDSHKTKA